MQTESWFEIQRKIDDSEWFQMPSTPRFSLQQEEEARSVMLDRAGKYGGKFRLVFIIVERIGEEVDGFTGHPTYRFMGKRKFG